ncbi:hypothetical protein SAY87_026463 [Trapa incisa]|uniref:Glycosyltransferase n=1 Tax=Trapa incisa TaxID=236973 RepID=A0AAN7GUJ2_9MYRT|nr:hypothetical protein SAY87_026463 [Trapa incisa]
MVSEEMVSRDLSFPAGMRGDHALIIPFTTSGHFIPLLDLTRHLVLRGLTVTVVATSDTLPLLSPLISDHPSSIKALVLPLCLEATSGWNDLTSCTRTAIRDLGTLHGPIRDWIAGHHSPPSVIISDMFAGWAHRLAQEVGIKSILFSPSGAMALSVIFSLWRDMPRPPPADKEDTAFAFPEIPNQPEYPWWQLSGLFRAHREGDPVSEFIKEAFLANSQSWGVVVNSFNELEGAYIDHLMKMVGHGRVWAVGPLLPVEPIVSSGQRGGISSILVEDLVSWLDSCGDRTVLYVCFGSQARLAEEQTAALASALEKSEVNFVWVVREDQPTKVALESFEDRVAGRGLVIRGWAPQLPILNHPAVGAFLTHCGWNSIMEALVAGVPMLAWPMGADQFVNATLIADQLKVARRVSEGASAIPDSDKLARAIREFIDWEDCPERVRADVMRRAAADTMGHGGSSSENFDKMVKHAHV